MGVLKKHLFFESKLRAMCFVIAYWHLITILFNICSHTVVVYILTSGFSCDVSKQSLRAVQWDWLEPVLLYINFGAHGFYGFPLILNYHHAQKKDLIQYLPLPDKDPPCYPGYTNIDIDDVMYLVLNLLWLTSVVYFTIAVHKKVPGPMIAPFLVATGAKLVVQLQSFFILSSFNDALVDTLYKFVDVGLIILFMITVKNYVKELRKNKSIKRPGFIIRLLDSLAEN